VSASFDALFVDFGGVLTTSVFDAFGDYCESAGLPRDAFACSLRNDAAAARLLRDVETGHLSEADFELRFAPMLCAGTGIHIEPAGLIARLTTTLQRDVAMLDALGAVHEAGFKTAIVSNSFGYGAYDGYDLDRRVDHVVLSGDVGVRKPSRRIYSMAAEMAGVDPARCVFVDDLAQNVTGAERVGMTGIHHTDAAITVRRLGELFELDLASSASAA
jgi:putative hydrolase of the HAD superfamily